MSVDSYDEFYKDKTQTNMPKNKHDINRELLATYVQAWYMAQLNEEN